MSGLVGVTNGAAETTLQFDSERSATEAVKMHLSLPAALRVLRSGGDKVVCEPSTNVLVYAAAAGSAAGGGAYALAACMAAVRRALASLVEHHGDLTAANVQLVNRSRGRIKARFTGFVPRAAGDNRSALVAGDSARLLQVMDRMYGAYRKAGGPEDALLVDTLESALDNPVEFARGSWPEFDAALSELARSSPPVARAQVMHMFADALN